MSIYQAVKAAVSVKDAARFYGLPVSNRDQTNCLFHDDRHPSMKLNDDYYYCFACHAHGDVINLAARLFDLSNYHAALRLATDFGVDINYTGSAPDYIMNRKLKLKAKEAKELDQRCFYVLTHRLHELQDWKKKYDPKTPEDIADERYVTACKQLEFIDHLIQYLSVNGAEDRHEAVEEIMKRDWFQQLDKRYAEQECTEDDTSF